MNIFSFFTDKKKTANVLVSGLGVLFALNIVSTNTTVLEVQLVQFAGNPSWHGQRSSVSDEIKTSVVKSFLPDEFLTSP